MEYFEKKKLGYTRRFFKNGKVELHFPDKVVIHEPEPLVDTMYSVIDNYRQCNWNLEEIKDFVVFTKEAEMKWIVLGQTTEGFNFKPNNSCKEDGWHVHISNNVQHQCRTKTALVKGFVKETLPIEVGTMFEYTYWNGETVTGIAMITGSTTTPNEEKAQMTFFLTNENFLVDSKGVIWAIMGQHSTGVQSTGYEIKTLKWVPGLVE
jgi:hypothetical protein